ncbi:hypothetical protein LFL96_21010 [Paraburkholderia sp. D15]|uniref:hypothetical protein n=1 Tax=Paraburkholderia sp. D15 TaxID=2880218 RepID=UPI002479C2D1|nr:hypothetical protein [Paraburkholderia sp. D15]WGS53541.1 hypothetical protein LFL96_21010 [Paraburkholderia sp. D15]
MVKNSKQSWAVGQTVKVGFLALVVVTPIASRGDGLPGAYILTNGTQFYSFIPHNGLNKISPDDAVEMVEEGKRNAAAVEARAAAQAKRVIDNAAITAKLRDLAAPVAEFVGMADVDGESFAHYRNVAI